MVDFSFLVVFFQSPTNMALSTFCFISGFIVGFILCLKWFKINRNKSLEIACIFDDNTFLKVVIKENSRKIMKNHCRYLKNDRHCSKYNLECPLTKKALI